MCATGDLQMHSMMGTPFTQQYQFSANLIPGFADFSSAFDQYRIIGIEARFVPTTMPSAPFTTAIGSCLLVAAADLDGDSDPITEQSMFSYDKKQRIMLGPGQAGLLAFKPCFVGIAANTAGGTVPAVVGDPDQWIEMAYDNLVYNGLRVLITPVPSTAWIVWDLYFEYTIEFRTPI